MLSKSDLIPEVVGLAEGATAALLTGVLHGRRGEMPKIPKTPIPADAAVSLLGIGFGIWAPFGRNVARHTFRVVGGVVDYFTGSIGAQVGQRLRKNAGESVSIPTSRTIMMGELPQGVPQAGVTADDLRRQFGRVRR